MKPTKVMTIFGTRPEAIKLAPVIRKLAEQGPAIRTVTCVTAQHREMLDQVLDLFHIRPDHDLNIMTGNQSLFDITERALSGIRVVLEKERPDFILVQGDTTTTFIASLAAAYLKIPVGHIEAGLRTGDKHQPFPEEINRTLTTHIADLHFAPTLWAKQNLIREGVREKTVFVTGNTAIDALLKVLAYLEPPEAQARYHAYFEDRWHLSLPRETGPEPAGDGDEERIILVTGHRRENFGEGLESICLALKELVENNPRIRIVYPVHLNPNVQEPVREILGPYSMDSLQQGVVAGKRDRGAVHLIDPLEYAPFAYLMSKSYLILSDSGGIQEEAPTLAKPLLLMRDVTERPEGVEAGAVKLVSARKDKIVDETELLLADREAYENMANVGNPYGDGKASQRIVETILSWILDW